MDTWVLILRKATEESEQGRGKGDQQAHQGPSASLGVCWKVRLQESRRVHNGILMHLSFTK